MAQDPNPSGKSGSMSPYGPPTGHFRWHGFPWIMVINQPAFRDKNHW